MEQIYAQEIRHEGTKTGWSLMGYVLIMNVVVVVAMVINLVNLILEKSGGDIQILTIEDYEMIAYEAIESMLTDGTSSIIAVCIGILLLIVAYKGKVSILNMWTTSKKMSLKDFFMLFCIFMACQPIFNLFSYVVEALLNSLGYSAQWQLEWASGTRNTISMILYAGFIGPIAEEIVYRGFILKSLSKYGKHFAIVCSSVAFGVIHANIHQIFFAMLVGLVLGYVATEYSLKWAVLIHIINNFVFSQVLGELIGKFPETTQNIIWYSILGLFFIAAVIIIWKYRDNIKKYFQENTVMKKQYGKFFISAGMLVFVIFHVFIMVVGIIPIDFALYF